MIQAVCVNQLYSRLHEPVTKTPLHHLQVPQESGGCNIDLLGHRSGEFCSGQLQQLSWPIR